MPVLIEDLHEDASNPRLTADQWKNDFRDKNIMMIITPCFPCMNCSHNVSPTTLRIVQKELYIASSLFRQVREKKKPLSAIF
jgi:poly(A) polymerase